MDEKNKKEELQSRREFFKKAAKKALPIVAAVALVSIPNVVKASEKTSSGCNHYCSGGCSYTCEGCEGTCSGTCTGCTGTCKGNCYGSCENSCSGGCYHTCEKGCQTTCKAVCANGLRNG